MTANIEIGTDENFGSLVKQSDMPVLVDFWAPWCGPCRMVGPILEEISAQYTGRAKVVKLNVDESQQVAGEMGIRSIPTLAVFKNGEVRDVLIGVRPKAEITAMLDKALAD